MVLSHNHSSILLSLEERLLNVDPSSSKLIVCCSYNLLLLLCKDLIVGSWGFVELLPIGVVTYVANPREQETRCCLLLLRAESLIGQEMLLLTQCLLSSHLGRVETCLSNRLLAGVEHDLLIWLLWWGCRICLIIVNDHFFIHLCFCSLILLLL